MEQRGQQWEQCKQGEIIVEILRVALYKQGDIIVVILLVL